MPNFDSHGFMRHLAGTFDGAQESAEPRGLLDELELLLALLDTALPRTASDPVERLRGELSEVP